MVTFSRLEPMATPMMNPTIKITVDVDLNAKSLRLRDLMGLARAVGNRLSDGPADCWRICEVGHSRDQDFVTVRLSTIVAESSHAAVLDWLQDNVYGVDRVVLAPAVA